MNYVLGCFLNCLDFYIQICTSQEFTEVRRRLDRAPQVLYSHRVPPKELQGTDAVISDSVAYITFGKSVRLFVFYVHSLVVILY